MVKGSSRRAEKSRKVLMMMKAAKLVWALGRTSAGADLSRVEHSRVGAGLEQEQSRSRAGAGAGQEQGQEGQKQGREGAGQK